MNFLLGLFFSFWRRSVSFREANPDRTDTRFESVQRTQVLLILGMCLLEHIIACGWFGIGHLEATKKSRAGCFESLGSRWEVW